MSDAETLDKPSGDLLPEILGEIITIHQQTSQMVSNLNGEERGENPAKEAT